MLPLIDMMFLLLVFFIYAMLAMVTHQGLAVNLPGAQNAILDERAYIAVTLLERGDIFLNNQPVTLDDLTAQIHKLRLNPEFDMPIYIQGDRAAHFGVAIQILDHLTRAGIKEVFFACATNE